MLPPAGNVKAVTDILTATMTSIMMLTMRTTLTLDPEVARRIRSEVRRSGKSFKAVVNDAIKAGLGLRSPQGPAPRFVVTPHHFGVRAGIDLDRINQLVDELDSAERAEQLRK